MGPVICLVTDRRGCGDDWENELVRRAGAAARAGVHLIQIRERGLEAREHVRLVSRCVGEVAGTAARVDHDQLAVLALKLRAADRVFLAGAGRSGLVLRMAAMRLMHLGLTVHVAGDTTTPAISSGDLLLLASGSGTTSGVVKAAQTAAEAGAQVVAVTTNRHSPLAAPSS